MLSGNQSHPDASRWQAEADAAHSQLAELAEVYGNRGITLREWLAARHAIEVRLASAQQQLRLRQRTSVLSELRGSGFELRSAWPQLSLSRQRAIIATVADHFLVARGRRGYNRFDPSRVTPVWRV